MSRISVEGIATSINKDCHLGRYFWACGLVRETINLWRMDEYRNMLCKEARMMADHYRAEGEEN